MERSEVRPQDNSLRISQRARGALSALAVAGAVYGGVQAVDHLAKNYEPPVVRQAHAEGIGEGFMVVCEDEAGDVKPKSADILRVETSKDQENTYFSFNLAGNVSVEKSIIGPESAFGVAFIDVDGLSRAILQVKGAPNTEDVLVMLEQLKAPVDPNDNMPMPVESDSILETFGVENVKVDETGTIVTFSIPSEFIDQFSGEVIAFSTESNGNVPTVVINGDICKVEPKATPTRVSETSSTVLPPNPTETPEATPEADVLLPETGYGIDGGSKSKVISAAVGGLLAGAFSLGVAAIGGVVFPRNRKK